jgi:hypothetical protein
MKKITKEQWNKAIDQAIERYKNFDKKQFNKVDCGNFFSAESCSYCRLLDGLGEDFYINCSKCLFNNKEPIGREYCEHFCDTIRKLVDDVAYRISCDEDLDEEKQEQLINECIAKVKAFAIKRFEAHRVKLEKRYKK